MTDIVQLQYECIKSYRAWQDLGVYPRLERWGGGGGSVAACKQSAATYGATPVFSIFVKQSLGTGTCDCKQERNLSILCHPLRWYPLGQRGVPPGTKSSLSWSGRYGPITVSCHTLWCGLEHNLFRAQKVSKWLGRCLLAAQHFFPTLMHPCLDLMVFLDITTLQPACRL